MYSVGHMLKRWLDRKNEGLEGRQKYTQRQLALAIGVTEKHMSNILNGKAHLTALVAVKLEAVTGISASTLYLVDGDYQIWKIRNK